jgi:flagellin
LSLATGFTTGSTSFTVGDGGATFQLGTDSSTQATLGISAMFSNMLGSASLGYLSSVVGGGSHSLTADPTKAVEITKQAVQQIALARGRVGGFQKYMVGTSMNALKATQQALSDATDSINAVDYAQATSELNRQQVLMNAAVSLLGIANNQSQSILSLLR